MRSYIPEKKRAPRFAGARSSFGRTSRTSILLRRTGLQCLAFNGIVYRQPALAFARILALAGVVGRLAGALALASINSLAILGRPGAMRWALDGLSARSESAGSKQRSRTCGDDPLLHKVPSLGWLPVQRLPILGLVRMYRYANALKQQMHYRRNDIAYVNLSKCIEITVCYRSLIANFHTLCYI